MVCWITILTMLLAFPLVGHTMAVPENNLYIGVNHKEVSTITENDFNSILDRLQQIYTPIINAKGYKFVIEREWLSGEVNASARRIRKGMMIIMYGGLARHPAITPDAFTMIACHELGHHLGGLPKHSGWSSLRYFSNEGQADYFASTKCFRKFAESDDNIAIIQELVVPPVVRKKCQQHFIHKEEIAICVRGAMAALSMSSLFKELDQWPAELKFDTPDTKVVKRTINGHPNAQCRLDTIFQAALCDKSAYLDLSFSDVNQGACTRISMYKEGMRPRCWFKPE